MAKRRRGNSQAKIPKHYGILCADAHGNFWDEPELIGLGRTAQGVRLPRPEELSPLPEGAQLQFLPGCHPLVRTSENGADLVAEECWAMAAQLPSGWTRTLLPAWEKADGASDLPIFGYTAVFCRGGQLYAAAYQTEDNPHWRPRDYARPDLPKLIADCMRRYPHNRLYKHLQICACDYGCYNAQNIFYGRWEGAAPSSPVCNAGCQGCISYQPAGRPPSPQVRLRFVPSAAEIAEIGVRHLAHPQAIYSFGQGCEGEPLLQADTIAAAIKIMRTATPAGAVHMNTNGSRPEAAKEVFAAGLDSLRVSMNSVLPDSYNAYYRPRGYKMEDVWETVREARKRGLWVSINWLCLPGLNDSSAETEAMIDFVREYDVNMIQLRNLNMDPDMLLPELPQPTGTILGVTAMIKRLREAVPQLRIGCHNPYKPLTLSLT
ncbi:MAG: radical SAM protein [bacterium]|nr:radical SAM protein [bacterium]